MTSHHYLCFSTAVLAQKLLVGLRTKSEASSNELGAAPNALRGPHSPDLGDDQISRHQSPAGEAGR